MEAWKKAERVRDDTRYHPAASRTKEEGCSARLPCCVGRVSCHTEIGLDETRFSIPMLRGYFPANLKKA